MQPRFFKNLGPFDLKKIKLLIECSTHNISDDAVFFDITSIDKLKKNGLSFVSNADFIIENHFSVGTIICTEIIGKRLKGKSSLIIVKDTQTAISILSNSFYRSFTKNEIYSLDKPRIDHSCEIDKTAVIENGSLIGNNVKIGHGCFIGYNSVIGDNTSIDSNSVITNSIIAENVAIGRNVSIGQQGFGFAINRNKNIKIQHIGKVIIQSGVSIGSNCTIDRGSFSDTIIGENSYFDNLCHIAHNVIIGNNCIFAGMSGIAGSTIVGNNVMAGGQTGIAGHLKIGNNVRIAAQSGVLTNIQDNSSVMGHPAINKFKYIKKYKKNYA